MPNQNQFNIPRKLIAEALGTAFLVMAVVGSGIMGEQLAGGNAAIALLANTIATGAALVVLIFIFAPISGAHFNPIVSLSFTLQGKMRWSELLAYIAIQVAGGIAGTIMVHIMFDLPLVTLSTHERTGLGMWTGEIVASFGLLATILGCLRNRPDAIPYAVGLYITSAYWFTSSTSFANPAVTIARSLTDTFSSIQPIDVGGFIFAQVLGSLLATYLLHWFWKTS